MIAVHKMLCKAIHLRFFLKHFTKLKLSICIFLLCYYVFYYVYIYYDYDIEIYRKLIVHVSILNNLLNYKISALKRKEKSYYS